MSKIHNFKQNPLGHQQLEFGACLEFVIWDLGFKDPTIFFHSIIEIMVFEVTAIAISCHRLASRASILDPDLGCPL